jgi:hypothetical protein
MFNLESFGLLLVVVGLVSIAALVMPIRGEGEP